LAELCEGYGQIGGDGGLALSGVGAANEQRTWRTIGGRKQDRCSQTAKRFDQRCMLRSVRINSMPCRGRLPAVPISIPAESFGVFQQPVRAAVIAI
jgi:hypothetical protein